VIGADGNDRGGAVHLEIVSIVNCARGSGKCSTVAQSGASLRAVERRRAGLVRWQSDAPPSVVHGYTSLSAGLTKKEDEPDTTRYTWQFGYTRFWPNQWVVNPLVLIESNPDFGI
jgi:hypothetical protein